MHADRAYAHEVHTQLGRYATWLPGDHLEVGAVGRLSNEIFYPETNLDHFGIPFNVVDDPKSKTTYKFMSSGTQEVTGSASASVLTSAGPAAATLTVNFSKENSVYFLLTDCVGSAVDDLAKLGMEILKQTRNHAWPLDYVVVTRIVTAQSATILQAESKNASIVLEGGSDGVPVLEALRSHGKLSVKSQNSVGFSAVAQRKSTPLLNLSKVYYTFWDSVLGKEPDKFGDARDSISVKRLSTIVDALPNVQFSQPLSAKNDLRLDVTCARYGDFVDIGDLLDFTSRASGTKLSEPSGLGRSVTLNWNPRVNRTRLSSAVNKSKHIDIDRSSRSDDHIRIRITLPKSGATVNLKPLTKLTINTAEPKPRMTANAELLFDEIA
jgi:hypothetical protein